MSFKVRIPSPMQRKIALWNLPDPILVEVYLRLHEDLSSQPQLRLVPRRRPFKGMNYSFGVSDQSNRLRHYIFSFQIVYGQDEETLTVIDGSYQAEFGAGPQ